MWIDVHGLVLAFNNGLLIQWLPKILWNNVPAGSSERNINLPTTFSRKVFTVMVGHIVRADVVVTWLGNGLNFIQVGIGNYDSRSLSQIGCCLLVVGI